MGKVHKFDNIDNIKPLQLEGGLSVTAFGVYGLYSLADKLNKSPSVKSVSFYLCDFHKSISISRVNFS